jgi:hypothetical protein
MRIDWRNDPNAPRSRTVNLDTGEQIVHCFLCDEETGEYEAWASTQDGKFLLDERKNPHMVKGRCNLRIDFLIPGEPYLLASEEYRKWKEQHDANRNAAGKQP